MYITSAYLEPGDLSIQASTFAGIAEKLDVRKMIDATKILQKMSQTLGEELKISDLSPDWCSGVRELWLAETDHTDPCAALSEDFGRLRAKVIEWEAPQDFLRSFSRWQFSVAPNISRLEVLTDILEKTQTCIFGSSLMPQNFSSELTAVAADDLASLDEEYHILRRVVKRLDRAADREKIKENKDDSKGLLGLIRGLLEVQHTIHLIFDEASTWAFRIKTRGNGLQLRLQEVAGKLTALHETLKSLPNYRRLAFKEIHSAGHWGRSTSGTQIRWRNERKLMKIEQTGCRLNTELNINIYQAISTCISKSAEKQRKPSRKMHRQHEALLYNCFTHQAWVISPDVLVISCVYCLSGSGSSQQATSSLALSFLEFLQDLQGELHSTDGTLRSLSILDVGCGWGEWLPAMLVKATGEAKLENLIYFGIDIAEKPIHSLQARFRDFHFAAAWMIFDVVFLFFSRFSWVGMPCAHRGQQESTK